MAPFRSQTWLENKVIINLNYFEYYSTKSYFSIYNHILKDKSNENVPEYSLLSMSSTLI